MGAGSGDPTGSEARAPLSQTARAALYVRVSTDAQAERWSLPAQRAALVEHAERQGWEWEIYEDAGISGETLDARPAMLRLLEDAKARRVQVALAVEMERFSRSDSLFDWLVIKQAFRQGRVRFGTPAQLYDPADTEDDFLTDLFGALAKREKRKIVERTRRGRYQAARSGRHMTRPPYGYRHVNGELVVHEPEAEVVRRIFRLVARGASLYGVAQSLNAEGVPPPGRARAWTMPRVALLLRNSTYWGTAYYGRERVAGRQGRRRVLRPSPPREWVAIPVPAIVDEGLARLVAERLRRNSELAARRQRGFYLLKGLVRCAACGRSMVGKAVKRGQRYYTCWRPEGADSRPRCRWHAANAAKLESLVWERLRLALRDPGLVLAEAREYRESRVSERDEALMRLEYLRKALGDVPRERERAQVLYVEGYATLDETRARLEEIERRRARLEDEARGLEARLSEVAATGDQSAALEDIVGRVARRLDRLSDAERFEVVHAFVDRVIVAPGGHVEIQGYVPIPAGGGPGYVRTVWAAARGAEGSIEARA